MSKTIAIICEYNPFHNGHIYQIETQKKLTGAEYVIAVMSGNFVQRGSAAICDKWTRAKAAIYSGCDLVIELPCVWATQSAERFAKGAVGLIDALSIVDYLSFGSECGNIEILEKVSELLEENEIKEKTAEYLKDGVSYPKAREMALGVEYGKILAEPNNILAIEYIKAIREIKSNILPLTIKREKCEHDAKEPNDEFASASFLRQLLKEGRDVSSYMPSAAASVMSQASIYSEDKIFDNIITYLLRVLKKDELSLISDVTEGIENRFKEAARLYHSASEISEYVKTKRYTKTRIDRILINILLNIKKDDVCSLPEYIRVLGFNDKGRELISRIKNSSHLPIITKTADAKLSAKGEEMFSKDVLATDIYSLLNPAWENGASGLDYKKSPIVVR